MNQEKGLSRREFVKTGVLTGAAVILSACGKNPEKTQVFLERTSQKLIETANALDTRDSVLKASQTAQAQILKTPDTFQTPLGALMDTPHTETPSPYLSEDINTLNELRITEGGEKLTMENALISYVVKIPRPFASDAVYGVLAVNTKDGEKGAALIENFDCAMDILEENDLLGDPIGSEKSPAISGLWKPDIRFENISGTMFVEPSLGTIAVVTGTSYQFGVNDPEAVCPKNSVFSGAGEIPRILAQESGKLIKTLIEEFKAGYFEEK